MPNSIGTGEHDAAGPLVLAAAMEQAAEAVLITDVDGRIQYANGAFERLTGYVRAEVFGQSPSFLKSDKHDEAFFADLWRTVSAGKVWQGRITNRSKDGGLFTVEATVSPLRDSPGAISGYLSVARDVTNDITLETQLLHALKMESVGELASGIAHEINTPTQYIGDNIRFFQEVFGDILELLKNCDRVIAALRKGNAPPDLLAEIEALCAKMDLDYLVEEIPSAIAQSLEGVGRVSEIVRAMKEFAHPGAEEMTAIDINRAIQNTISVARNEWKYVAEVHTELDAKLPLVTCLPGAFNQVLLNIFVNAAQAIGEVVGKTGTEKGAITVSTRRDGDWAEIRISDTGPGIPEALRQRIFDPFFTTKGIGKGTGQGLASVHFIIVKKHQGTVSFETEVSKGTTFIIRLPMRGEAGE